MAQPVTFNSSSIYNSSKARNFFKRFLRQSRNPSHSPRTAVPSLYPVLDFRPINPRREPICLNIRKISSYCTRVPHNLKNCITSSSSSSSKSSIFAKNFSGTATDTLKSGAKMTVAAAPCIKDGSLMANGKVVLTGVPSNVAVYPVTDGLSSSSSPSAAFLGASSVIPSSDMFLVLGFLRSDIPVETQLLLLEVRENSAVCDDISSGQSADNTFYVLLLPVLEGQFRATLQGTKANELEFCVESGDAHVQTTKVSEAVFINSGDNPFELIKESLEFVYVWHALVGYWGGILPSSEKMKKYNPEITYPVQSPGNVGNLRDIAMDSLEKYGVGLIDPEKVYNFYNDLHSYLSSSGVDGIKVDVQNLIETLGGGHGGRVSLTRKYQEALEESVARNFKENNLICCMSHNTDSIYSLLKIWNLNKFSGVVGVFNCQGAGNWPLRDGPERNPSSSSDSLVLSGHVSPQDVDFLDEVAHETWSGDCAVYAFHTGSLSRLSKEENVKVSLATLECEIFTVSPIRVINEPLHFAPIGLIDMYNSGGATEGLCSTVEPSACTITIQARGCGRFGAYSSKKPISCTVDGKNEEFVYRPDDGLLIVKLEGECKSRDINFCY
ncbi:UNVERIFIED_CONTAM: putative galactinol--sucrose galactosyltransferase 2 [Sesamum radiatum]|uniref:Galactinol--sucrose galactosyltransferase 2 n=1 Tax=Sesamum radiatum TaxID=300843 RepID=A0AAW2PP83_SESRA